MAFGKNSDVEITRPLKHRPGVKVFKLNGTYKVMGDGGLYTPEEHLLLHGGYAESTTPRLKFTDSEQAEINAAEDRLTRASALVDQLYAEGNRLSAEMKQASDSVDPYGYRKLTDQERDIINGIQVAAHELTGRINEAGELEKSALTERNAIQQRITAAARARQFPPTFHNPKLSTDERLANLEERK